MLPAQRHHPNAEAESARQVEHLDVEAKAVDALTAENGPRRIGAEGFEAALRVFDPRHGQRLNDAVEDAAHQMAIPRLVNPSCAGTLARADDHRRGVRHQGHEARQVCH